MFEKDSVKMKKNQINEVQRRLKIEYKKSFEYVKESKNYIYVIIGIFTIFSLVGFFIPLPKDIYLKLIEYFKEIVGKTKGYGLLKLTGFIFSNNLNSTFFSMFLGSFLGIFPLINSLVNGVVLGVAANLSVTKKGIFSLLKILPYGIFELPAVFIALGLGLKFGTFILAKEKLKTFIEFFENSLRTYILIILPLLLVAAIIESALIIILQH